MLVGVASFLLLSMPNLLVFFLSEAMRDDLEAAQAFQSLLAPNVFHHEKNSCCENWFGFAFNEHMGFPGWCEVIDSTHVVAVDHFLISEGRAQS